ncbi:MAG: PAS domain S-box protein [Patescibacteria group bacterium]|nr:PAS domain S-box protein [Patescibacteria group bacterium]
MRIEYSKAISDHLASLSEVQTFLKGKKIPQQESILSILHHHYIGGEVFSAIYLMDKMGITYVSTNPDFVGKDYSFRPYFQNALQGEQLLYIAKGVTSNEPRFYVSTPVYDETKNLLGVIVVKINSTEIINAISIELTHGSGRTMILDDNRVIVFSSDSVSQYKTLWALSDSEKEALINENKYPGESLDPLGINEPKGKWFEMGDFTTLEVSDEAGAKKLAVLGKIGNGDSYLYQSLLKQDLTYGSLNLPEVLALLIFISVSSTIIILYLIIRKQSNPLKQIESYSREVSKGNFSFAVDKTLMSEENEIGRLAKSFEYMRERIQDLYKNMSLKIKSKTQVLDLKVKELEDTRLAMLSLLEDVKEEKNLSQKRAVDLDKFKLAVENASDFIVITDANGIIVYVNRAVKKITGFNRKEVIGQKAGSKQSWGGFMRKEVYEGMWKTIKIKKKVFEGEVQNMRKGGGKHTVFASISPVLDDSGQVVFFVGIERDVTKAKEVDRMKTEFVSIASHQLRTPLSALRWTLEMLIGGDAGKLEAGQDILVQRAYSSTKRMIGLVNGLLNVSRIESGQLFVEPSLIDIKKLAGDIICEFTKDIAKNKQRLTFNIEEMKLEKIKTDRKLLREVFSKYYIKCC